MLQSLIDYVHDGAGEEVYHLPLEDIAVASAWYASLDPSDVRRETHAAIESRVAAWRHEYSPAVTLTEGRRQQPLLRAAITRLEQGGPSALHPVELDLLLAAWRLIEPLKDTEHFERLHKFFARNAKPEPLATKRGAHPPTPGLNWLDRHIAYVTSAGLLRAHARPITTFGGVEMPQRSPMAVYRTFVRVLDSVPDDTALVVEGFGCSVNGYVMGRIAATGSCEVRENIAGVVIVRKGEIRARNVINNAYVVVKSGDVRIRAAENPKLIFAGDAIAIRDHAIGGRLTARTIAIDGTVTGGEYNVSKELTATRFEQSDSRELAIVLRRYISADDYGELIGEEASRLIGRLAKIRQRREHIRELIAMAEQECEHYASSAIMFLFGGDAIRKKIEELNRAQRRMAFLDRVIASIDALSQTTEDQLMAHARQHKTSELRLEEFAELDEFEHELSEMAAENEIDADLNAEREALRALTRELTQQRNTKRVVPSALFNLRERKVAWMLERDSLLTTIREIETLLRRTVGKGDLIEKADWEQNRGLVLAQLIAAARKRPPNDPLAERAASPYIRLMLRSIESRIHRSKNYRLTLEQLSADYTRQNGKLEEEFRLASPLQEQRAEKASVKVSGRFTKGVTLALERYLLATHDAPKGAVLHTADTGGETVTYRRHANEIRLSGSDDVIDV